MDFWAAVVLIVAVVVIGRVMSGGRWNKETRRWERHSLHNPYVRETDSDVRALKQEVERLNRRVATLEKLATDPSLRLSDEINRLRDRPPSL